MGPSEVRMKLIPYMGVGLPVVASPVRANAEIVRNGTTGNLASSQDQWADALDRLLEDPSLRWQMGTAGRRVVEEHFSAEVQAPRVGSILKAVAQ